MKNNKQAFIAKELLNLPDCVSLILRVIKVDFISFQKLCKDYNVTIQSERDRLSRHEIIKIKEPLIERIKELNNEINKSSKSPIQFNKNLNKNKPTMTHGPIFDKMANQKEKIKFINTPMRD